MPSVSAAPDSETKLLKTLPTSTISNTTAKEVTLGVKHPTSHVDVGVLGSIAARPRRTNTHFQVQWQPQVDECPSTAMAQETATKKGLREASRRPGPYFWIFLLTLLFFIFVWPGPVDLIYSKKNISLAYAMYLHRSVARETPDNCRGRRVYMYNLPPQFNIVVHNESRCNYSLMKWMDLCPRFGNGGYGERLLDKSKRQSNEDGFDYSQWFDTDGYMLEMIFHTRLQTYRCLTTDRSQADAFFIPYYTGLHALDHLYEMEDLTPTYEKRKLFGKELIDWLEDNGGDVWRRNGGSDHFLIMGRTSWDFRLQKMWGTGFSALPYVANMTALLLEKDTRAANEQAIPYPTAFHPASPRKLRQWIQTVQNAHRKYLFSYVGAPRPENWSVRGIISSSCAMAGASVCNLVDCSVVKCSHDPVSISKHFLQSTFCLQPRGDSATRKSTFDCLISGAIPVFFHVESAYTQYSWHLPPQPETYSVYIDQEDLKKGLSIHNILMSYSQEQIEEMRNTIVATIPNLLYNGYTTDPWIPRNRKDAFELSIERVLEKIARNRQDITQKQVERNG